MVEEKMRYYLEHTYETLRERCKELSGAAWQNNSLWFPAISELKNRKDYISDILQLNDELSNTIKYLSTKAIKGQEQTINNLSGVLDEKDKKIDSQKASIKELDKDKMTGLSKRDYFDELLAYETVDSLHRTNYTVARLDVNGLKFLNDNHGEKTGDKYLCTLGKAISTSISEHDWAFRMGGDEFNVVPKITPEQAENIIRNACEKLAADATDTTKMLKATDIITRRILSKFQKLWGNKFGITASFSYGAASINEQDVLKKILEKKSKIETEKESRQMKVTEVVDIIHEVANKRQKDHKAKLKSSGEYWNMTCISPEYIDDRIQKKPAVRKK